MEVQVVVQLELLIPLFVCETTISLVVQVFQVLIGLNLIYTVVDLTVAVLFVDVVEVDQDLGRFDLVALFADVVGAAADQVLDIEVDSIDNSFLVADMTAGIAEDTDIDTVADTAVGIDGSAVDIVAGEAVADLVVPIADALTADVHTVVDMSEVMYSA